MTAALRLGDLAAWVPGLELERTEMHHLARSHLLAEDCTERALSGAFPGCGRRQEAAKREVEHTDC